MSFFNRYFIPVSVAAAAFICTFSLCHLARMLAWRIDAIDYPGEARRVHVRPTPRIGGLGVFLSFLLVTAFVCDTTPVLVSAWAGGCLLFLTGLIDDTRSLDVLTRFGAQAVASLIAVLGGGLADFGTPFSVLLAVLFLVALTNAHNFIDGIDGLCAKLCAVEAFATGLLFVLSGMTDGAYAMLILGSAFFGFLPLGRAPARLFLGDCGSTIGGFLIGCFALRWVGLVRGTGGTDGGSALPLPMILLSLVFLFSVPLFDLFLAVLRRVGAGESPFLPDRRHLHHLLVDAGFSHTDTEAVLVTIGVISAVIAVSLSTDALWFFASLACVAAAFLLLWIGRRFPIRRAATRLRSRISEK